MLLFQSCAGRLNVLANVVRKPMAQIFSEFSGKKLTDHAALIGILLCLP
jgi:2-oxoglutarate dehydrogenase complex dehydrogenase (E1) component-like enzyme